MADKICKPIVAIGCHIMSWIDDCFYNLALLAKLTLS